MQMPLTLSDAEIRRLRDHEVLLTHVGITTLTSEEFRASADRIVNKFSQLTTQNIPKLNSEVGFKTLLGELKTAKIAKAVKEDAELVFSLARLMGLMDDTFEGSSLAADVGRDPLAVCAAQHGDVASTWRQEE